MARKLHEGQYALKVETSRKIVLHLKLTDSAQRAIDVLQNDAQAQRLKSNISFQGKKGVIQIPTRDGGELQSFTFSVAANNFTADCLQQFASRNSDDIMARIGEIGQKITIDANDDSYSTTRKRMEIAKELEKTISTKVIKQPSNSNLVNKRKLHRQVLLQEVTSLPRGRSSSPQLGKPLHPTLRSTPSNISFPTRPTYPAAEGDAAGMRSKTKPVLSSISSASSQRSTTSAAEKSLKESVLHHVAVRPIRMEELLIKLSRSGETCNVDRIKLQEILQRVATVNAVRPGINEYTLKPDLYNEVKAEWPGYNGDERAALRRKRAEIILRASENRKRPLEPSKVVAAGSIPALKNTEEEEESYSNPTRKKARVSLYKKPTPAASRPRSDPPLESKTASSKSTLKKRAGAGKNATSKAKAPSSQTKRDSNPKQSSADLSRENKLIHSPPVLSCTTTPPFSSEPFNRVPSIFDSPPSSNTVNPRDDNHGDTFERIDVPRSEPAEQRLPEVEAHLLDAIHPSQFSPSPPDEPVQLSKTEHEEYVKKYPPIDEIQKRYEYKRAFNADYNEYMDLHFKVSFHSKKFSVWQNELKNTTLNTEEYKKIKRQVYHTYSKLKRDKEFIKERNRLQYLHRKLKHIKNLVQDFDRKQNGNFTVF